jgi:PAS domain S-box-containing protein
MNLEREHREFNEARLVSSVRQHELADEAEHATQVAEDALKRSELDREALNLSEEHFRRAVEEAPIPMIMHAEDGEVLQISRTWTALTGYTLDDKGVIQSWLTKAYGFGGEEVRDAMQKAFLPPNDGVGPMRSVHFEIVTRSGERRTWSFSASSPGSLIDGRRFVVGTAEDITERIRAEAELRDNQKRLAESQAGLATELAATQQLQKVSIELIHEDDAGALYEKILDAAVTIMRSQFASMQMLHPERGERGELCLIGHRGFTPEAAKQWEWVGLDSKTACAQSLRTGERVVVPNVESCDWIIKAGVVETYLQTNIRSMQTTPLISRAGQLLGMISTHWSHPHEPTERDLRLLDLLARQAADLVERRQAEKALRESEERYRSLFDSMDEGYCVIEMIFDDREQPIDYRFLLVNSSFESQSGMHDVVGKRMLEFVPHIEEHWLKNYGEVATTGRSLRFANEYKSLNRWFDVYAFKADGWGDRKVAVLFTDITERRVAEQALSESELRLRLLIESATEFAIFTLTPDGLIDSWNSGAEKVFGWAEDEIIGKPGDILFTPEDRAANISAREMETAIGSGSAADERWHQRKDGSRFYVSGVMSLLKDIDGNPIGFTKIARDLTSSKKAEASRVEIGMLKRIVDAQEAERKRLARDLHDTLGQQFTALRLKLEAIKSNYGAEPAMMKAIDETQLIAKQIDDDIGFLNWELRPTALDNLGLRNALNTFVREWSKNHGIEAEFHSSRSRKRLLAPETEINLYRIAQEALHNVVKHAKAHKVSVLLEFRKDRAVLMVEDDGIGFNAGATGRAKKGGSRLGLIGMRERAALLGGTLEIESARGKGTTIIARVPATPANNDRRSGSRSI